MKKLLLSFIILSTLQLSYASSCIDLQTNLSRYQESSNVLAFQKFLLEKGYLKGTPNGYFGNGTYAAVKAYQKNSGLPPVGIVGPGTRAALKKDTCSSSNTAANPVISNPVIAKTEQAKSQSVATTSVIVKTEPIIIESLSFKETQSAEMISKKYSALYILDIPTPVVRT